MEIKPVGDLVILKRLDKQKDDNGNILLPIPNQKSMGRLLGVGRGILNKKTGTYDNLNLSEGDIVVFQTHRGHSVEGSVDNIFLGIKNILCVYKKEDLINGQMDISIKINDSVNNFNMGG